MGDWLVEFKQPSTVFFLKLVDLMLLLFYLGLELVYFDLIELHYLVYDA